VLYDADPRNDPEILQHPSLVMVAGEIVATMWVAAGPTATRSTSTHPRASTDVNAAHVHTRLARQTGDAHV